MVFCSHGFNICSPSLSFNSKVKYLSHVSPVPRHTGVPRADVCVTRQHFEGGRLSSSVNSQQTEALLAQKAIRLSQSYTDHIMRSVLVPLGFKSKCNQWFACTSPGETPTQIRSTAALFLPVYVCAEDTTIHSTVQHHEHNSKF